MCTHTFHSDDARDAVDANVGTDREFFDQFTGDKARVTQHWRGDSDFFFCRREVESEDDIMEVLEKLGANSMMITMQQLMQRFVTTYDIKDEVMVVPHVG